MSEAIFILEKELLIDFFIDGEVNCGRQLAKAYYNEKFNNDVYDK